LECFECFLIMGLSGCSGCLGCSRCFLIFYYGCLDESDEKSLMNSYGAKSLITGFYFFNNSDSFISYKKSYGNFAKLSESKLIKSSLF